MKILHLASEYPPQKVYGLGRFVQDLAVEQARQGHEVHVVTNSLGGRDHEIMDRGAHVHRVDFPPPPKPPDSGATVTQFNVQLIERVFKDGICPDADVVNAHDWLTSLACSVVAKRLGAGFVVTIHDLVVGKSLGELDNDFKYAGNVEHWACREADRLICVSEHTRREAIERYGALPERAFAVHNAVSEENFPCPKPEELAEFRRRLAGDDEKIVLYVGRLDREKGVDVLLRAFARVVHRGQRARLVIAGTGSLEEELRKASAEQGIQEAVTFAGYVMADELSRLYRSAQVLCVPSLYEPFGIVALEGMICGLPVVASATGGLTEIIDDGASGWLVPPGNENALANALSCVLEEAGVAQRLASSGQRRVREVFTWERVAKQIQSIYGGVSGARDRPLPAEVRRRVRVVYDCTAIHEGMTGIGVYAMSLLERLPSAWPEAEWILLVSPRGDEKLPRRFAHRRVVGTEEFELRFPARQQALARLMDETQADLYFGPMYDAPDGDKALSVTMVHDLGFTKLPGSLPETLRDYTVRSAEHAVRRSAGVVTVSESIRKEIIEHYGVSPDLVHVAPPGVDEFLGSLPPQAEQEEVLRKYGIERPYVLAVNLTNQRKNAARLFAAFTELISRREDPIHLVVAGGWDLSDANLWRMAYDAGVHDRTAVTGYVPRSELLSLYGGASVFCMPSLYEGFGMPVVEAMACGVPVVTSDRGAMREVAQGSAALVDPEVMGSIVGGLMRILEDAEFREECIRRGRERAQAFRWQRTAEVVAQVLRGALER